MDSLDKKKRDKAFSMVYFDIVNPRFRTPVTGHEKLGDLKIDNADYKAFRKKCFAMKSELTPNFVHNLVSSGLAWLFHMADKTSLPDMQDRQRDLIKYLELDMAEKKGEEEHKRLTNMIGLPKKVLRELPKRTDDYYKIYTYICNELVRKLLA